MKASEILSLTNPLVKHLVKIRSDRTYREKQKSLLVTGINLIEELLVDTPCKAILIEEGFPLPAFLTPQYPIYRTTREILKKISGLDTPVPLVAECIMPSFVAIPQISHLLVLDAISDPGNMGTLLRSACALGWDAVFLAPNCTDPFNEKALRAAKGATFRLSLARGSWDDLKAYLQAEERVVYLATLEGKPFHATRARVPCALILSNESQGASPSAKALGDAIAIPMQGGMQSLNVSAAGAILMYELSHSRKRSTLERDSSGITHHLE